MIPIEYNWINLLAALLLFASVAIYFIVVVVVSEIRFNRACDEFCDNINALNRDTLDKCERVEKICKNINNS